MLEQIRAEPTAFVILLITGYFLYKYVLIDLINTFGGGR